MSRIITIALCLLVLSSFLLVGCSSEPSSRFQKREGISANFPRDGQFQFNRSMNISEEDRQEMMEERQQLAIEACKDKDDGDACQLQARMGESDGICKFIDEDLVCIMDRGMRQR